MIIGIINDNTWFLYKCGVHHTQFMYQIQNQCHKVTATKADTFTFKITEQWVLCFPSEKHIEEKETWCQIKKLIVNKTSKLFQVVMRI